MVKRSAAIAAAMAALCSTAIASADEQYNGQTYAEAQQALSEAGMSSTVGSVTGDELPKAECIVTGSHTTPVTGASGATGKSEVVLHLDCNKTSEPAGQANTDAQQSSGESEAAEQATPGETGSAG